MATVILKVASAAAKGASRFRQGQITIGRAAGCTVPIRRVWLANQHVVIANSDDLVRVRLGSPDARATLAGRPLSTDWALAPTRADLVLQGSNGEEIAFELSYQYSEQETLLREASAVSPAPTGDAESDVVTRSGGTAAFVPAAENESPEPSAAMLRQARQSLKARQHDRRVIVLIALAVGFCLLVAGASIWNRESAAGVQRARDAAAAQVTDHLTAAREKIASKEYLAAKAEIDAAEALLPAIGESDGARAEIALLRESPEIRLGGNGYVQMERHWLPAATAQAWKEARDRDDPKIAAMERQATEAYEAKDYPKGALACEQALALIAAFPVKEHPRAKEIQTLLTRIKNDSIAAEMTAKGLVLYNDRWMTPEEKFRLEQQAKGLEEYKGKWLSKKEAFAARQTDKGLVLFEGKWMTPDEKMQAQGFVQFEGNWVKADERARILADRAAAAKAEEDRRLAAAKRLAEEDARRRAEELAAEKLKETAYDMSQVFVKRILKSPASAQFQPYTSDDVTVVYKDGWYLVRAVVDAQNSYGAILRRTYICKLRPTGGGQWESALADLIE